jgi:ubiquinone/menaquinone biosynthesis C-methylase UbiE
MNNDKEQTIYDFDFSLLCEYFSSIERQGPGSEEMTKLALSFIDGLTEDSKIADLGCGTGGQTATLAQNIKARITALDLFPTFIDKLRNRFANLKLSDRVNGIVGSMDELPFSESEFDVIWCEGAIYNIGFKHGLEYWRKFIKTGGYVAVTEASWFTENRPKEIDKFWNEAYSEIDTIPNKVKQMQAAGYIPVATFILPEECWTDNFYTPQKGAQEIFLRNHPGNPTAENLIKYQRHEAELYSKYKQYYGYVFYIGKKISI